MDANRSIYFIMAANAFGGGLDDYVAVGGLDVEIEICCVVRVTTGAIAYPINCSSPAIGADS